MGQSSSTGKVAKVAQYNPKYEVIREVSDPNYGKVKLIRLQSPDRTQMILKEFVYDNKKAYETEAEFFQNRVAFDHPNVVRVIGYNSRNEQNLCSNFYRVSVFVEILVRDLNSDIQDHKMNQSQYPESDILLLAENLLNALSFLQKNHIAHGDIRPLNIFVQDDRYKLTDPKLEIDKNSDAYLKAVLNKSKTLLSPQLLSKVPTEKLQHDDVDKFKADVFSLGVTLLSVATLTEPEDLYDYSTGIFNENLLHERLHFLQQTRSDFTFNLIESMVRVHEQDRPDFIALNGVLAPHAEEIRNRELNFLGNTREVSHVHVQERGQEIRKKAAHQSKPLSSQELPHEEEDIFGSERTQEKASEHHHQPSHFHHMSSLAQHGHSHEHHHHHGGHSHSHVHSANNFDTDDLELQIQRALQRSRDTYQQVYGTQVVSQKLGISAGSGQGDIRTQTFGERGGTSGAQYSFGNAGNTQESAHEAHHHNVANIANPFYTEGVKSHTVTGDIRAREESDRVVRSAASQGSHARHASAQIPVTTTTTTPIVNTDHEAMIQEILRKYQQPAVSTTTYSTEFKPASYTTTSYAVGGDLRKSGAGENIKRSGLHEYSTGISTFPEPSYNKYTSQIEYTTSTIQPEAGRSAEVERILRGSNVGTGVTSYEYSVPKTSYTTTTYTTGAGTGALEGSPAGLKQSRSKYSRPEELAANAGTTAGTGVEGYHYTSTGYTGPSAGVQELLAELKRKEDLRKSGAGETAGYTYTSYSTKAVPTTVVSTTVNGEPVSYGQTSQVRSLRNPGEVLAEAGSALSKYSADGVTVHEEHHHHH
jgi:serine/threonine protein kinase